MRELRPGVVSVVLVNFKGTDDTLTCIRELQAADWPAERLEIIVVENDSGDEFAGPLRDSALDFRLIETGANLGFTGGCNRGVAESTGEYVAFLNNDARPDSAWIRAAVATFERDQGVGAVASKVLDWDGVNVDFTEASITWYGMGYKPHAGQPDTGEWTTERDVLFGTGAAMFIRATVFEELGGFDDRYFMFYDDVDLGWRLNLLGWTMRYQPASIAFHKHHASMKAFGEFRETYLLERNALFTLYKNLGDDELDRVLPAAIALAIRRAVGRGELDSTQLDLRRKGDDRQAGMPVSRMTMAGVFAVDQFVEQLPSLAETRREVQRTRRRSDRELRHLFGNVDEPAYPIAAYLDGYARILAALDPAAFHTRRRILMVVADVADARRQSELARRLAVDHAVRMVGIDVTPLPDDTYEVASAEAGGLAAHEEWAQLCIAPLSLVESIPELASSNKPFVLTVLAGDLDSLSDSDGAGVRERLLAETDFVLVDSDETRRRWLGMQWATGRLTRSFSGASLSVAVLPAVAQERDADGDVASVQWVGSRSPAVHAMVLEAVAALASDAVTLVDGAEPPTLATIVDASDVASALAVGEAVLRSAAAGSPIIALGSGPIADRVAADGLGLVVETVTAESVAAAITSLARGGRAGFSQRLEAVREGIVGTADLTALIEFCLRPTRGGRPVLSPPAPPGALEPTPFAADQRAVVPVASRARAAYHRYVPTAIRGRITRWRA